MRWYFVVFVTIDGFSRLLVALECRSNNKAETVLECFFKGVENYSLPSRVRSDKVGDKSTLYSEKYTTYITVGTQYIC